MHFLRSSDIPPSDIWEVQIQQFVGELFNVKVFAEILCLQFCVLPVPFSDLDSHERIDQVNIWGGDLRREAGVSLQMMP